MKRLLAITLTVLMLTLTITVTGTQQVHAAEAGFTAVVNWATGTDIDFANVDHYRIGMFRKVEEPTAVYWEVLCGGWIGLGFIGTQSSAPYAVHFESPVLPTNIPPTTTSYDVAPFLDNSQFAAGVEVSVLLTIVYKNGLGIKSIIIPVEMIPDAG